MTHREFEILRYLAERRDRVVHRDELLREVWEIVDGSTTRAVDFAVARLRQKIEPNPPEPKPCARSMATLFADGGPRLPVGATISPTIDDRVGCAQTGRSLADRLLAPALACGFRIESDAQLRPKPTPAWTGPGPCSASPGRMTSMLHRFDDDSAFDHRRELAELDQVITSRAAALVLAENYRPATV